MTDTALHRIQQALRERGIPAWLLFSFRDWNPIAGRVVGLPPGTHQSRRWATLIPAEGAPRSIAHRIEGHMAAALPGEVVLYSSLEEFIAALRDALSGITTVAMEYSPMGELPIVARIDGGTIELVRSLGVDVASSADLIATLDARLDTGQLASARRAGAACREVMMETFAHIRDLVASGATPTEYEVQRSILRQFEVRGLETDHAPNVSVGAHSADPHYEPTPERSAAIRPGDFVLVDLWARERGEQSVYGDITWTGYVGTEVPERYTEVFTVVRNARDAALDAVRASFAAGNTITGAELDTIARTIITDAGYGSNFVHRLGHSITVDLHGAGANLDGYETLDRRAILPGTSFSIEPGIYLPGEFGVRSELDVVIDDDGTVHATSEPLQTRVLPLLE